MVQAGHQFSFSVLCGDRLGRLILHLHTAQPDLLTQRGRAWVIELPTNLRKIT